MLTSILDNDFYKFTMQQAVFQLFPRAKVKYEFINRGKHAFPEDFSHHLEKAIQELENLKLTKAEKNFLAEKCPYFTPTYLDFLEGFRYACNEVSVAQHGGELSVKIEGYWYRTILWEVVIMALICELYYKHTQQSFYNAEEIETKTLDKFSKLKKDNIQFADFGTRRRYSFAVQDWVVKTLTQHAKPNFIGTSNVHLAMKYQVKPIGTHAHEWFMFHAAKYGFKMANQIALENWVNVYRGDLGIALTDTFTTESFFEVFDKKFAKLFDGLRHDSGNPIEFGNNAIKMYENYGIDPKSKTIIFSDGLNVDKVLEIDKAMDNRINRSYGIGTNLTNDVGYKPMNIVLKMVSAKPENSDWTGVIKLSDEPKKHTGNIEDISLAKQILDIT